MSSLNLTELTVGQKSFLRARGYDPMAINGRATQQGFFFLRFFFIYLLVRPIPSEYKEENWMRLMWPASGEKWTMSLEVMSEGLMISFSEGQDEV